MSQNNEKAKSEDELESCLNQEEICTNYVSKLDTNHRKSNLCTDLIRHISTKDGIKEILNSNKLHVLVILLVILDCTCISTELMLDFIINYNREHRNTVSINIQNSSSRLDLFEVFKGINPKMISILSTIEHSLRFISLTILAFFVLEIVLKLIFIPYHVIKSIWGILDAIVVFVSFFLDIFLLKNKQILHTVTGLLTLFRLWRVARILSGILVTMEKKSTKKILKLTKTIESLTEENRQLRKELEQSKFILEKYMIKNQKNFDSNYFA